MGLNLEKKQKESVTIYGTSYEVSKPTVKQLADFKASSLMTGFDEFAASVKMLEELGLPNGVILDLSPADFSELIEYLFDTKKK